MVVRLAGCKPAHARVLLRPNTVCVFGLPASLACLVFARPDGNMPTAVTAGPLVGVLVGSESDRERMQGAFDELDKQGISYEFGVPLRSTLSVLDGVDALLAIAQMPPGVPVAAVGVDNARNAAALAARILSIG